MDKGACPAVFLCQPRHDLRFTLSSNADGRLRCASGHAERETHTQYTHNTCTIHACMHVFDNMEKYLNNECPSGNDTDSELIYAVYIVLKRCAHSLQMHPSTIFDMLLLCLTTLRTISRSSV